MMGPIFKSGFHMIVTIGWIAVNDSSDPDRCDRWWIAGIEQHCVPLAIETIKIAFKVSQLDLIALK